jgi:hypothetical protein
MLHIVLFYVIIIVFNKPLKQNKIHEVLRCLSTSILEALLHNNQVRNKIFYLSNHTEAELTLKQNDSSEIPVVFSFPGNQLQE